MSTTESKVLTLAAVTDHLLDESRKEMEIEGLGVSPRYLWQTLGTEWGRERVRADFWIKLLEARIERERRYQWLPQVAIADVRFANEAHWVANQPAGEVWRIVRPGCEAQARNHASEQGIPPEFITAGIVNDGDIAQLAARVQELLG